MEEHRRSELWNQISSLCETVRFLYITCKPSRGLGFVALCFCVLFWGLGTIFLANKKPVYFQTTVDLIPDDAPRLEKKAIMPDYNNIEEKNGIRELTPPLHLLSRRHRNLA
ncbi:hypothetical protein AAMO2058_000759200 [Amorphochlora amoebiformis]